MVRVGGMPLLGIANQRDLEFHPKVNAKWAAGGKTRLHLPSHTFLEARGRPVVASVVSQAMPRLACTSTLLSMGPGRNHSILG
jgi:hypothetical protein